MCLVSDKPKQVATEDIVCYKVTIFDEDKLITPYERIHVKLNELLIDTEPEHIIMYHSYSIVESGYFHMCLTKLGINCILKNIKKFYPRGTVVKILKAIIPKDTEYYINQTEDTICSKKVIYYEAN